MVTKEGRNGGRDGHCSRQCITHHPTHTPYCFAVHRCTRAHLQKKLKMLSSSSASSASSSVLNSHEHTESWSQNISSGAILPFLLVLKQQKGRDCAECANKIALRVLQEEKTRKCTQSGQIYCCRSTAEAPGTTKQQQK